MRPALNGHNYWLVVITMINAAISAGYYLRIVGAMFLRPEPQNIPAAAGMPEIRSTPVTVAIVLSVIGVLMFGAVPAATEMLSDVVASATTIDAPSNADVPGASVSTDLRGD